LLTTSRIPGSAALAGSFAAIIFAIPVFFAGLLFASEFRSADSAAALGANPCDESNGHAPFSALPS